MSLQFLIDDALAETPPGRIVWVALSGGLDSSLLLALAAEARDSRPFELRALHVDHGLQAAAAAFEAHCRELCVALNVPLVVERVEVTRHDALGLEAAAREARYAAFARHVSPGDDLWLAQHRNDQAETFLLAALRGSGVRGMAAMPAVRDWRGRRLVRPLLAISRARLEEEAQRRGLTWVEDPSNVDERLDRNFLRHRVLPLVESRWPGARASLAQAARLAGEADALLGELAEADLAKAGGDPGWLAVSTLMTLSEPRRRLLIRHCCERLALPLPPAARLATLIEQLPSRPDGEVHVGWPGGEARLWRGRLFLQPPQRPLPAGWHDRWDGRTPVDTPVGRLEGTLRRRGERAVALSLKSRLGGERLRLAGRGSRDLKRLLQERGVPPWRRGQVIVVWHGEEVVAVFAPGIGEPVSCAEGWDWRPGEAARECLGE